MSSSESSILDVGAVQALLQKNLDASLSVLENRSNAEEESPRNDDDEEDIISTSESSVLDFGAVNALLQNNLVNALSLLEDDDESRPPDEGSGKCLIYYLPLVRRKGAWQKK